MYERRRQRSASGSSSLQLAAALRSKRLRSAHDSLLSSIDASALAGAVSAREVPCWSQPQLSFVSAYGVEALRPQPLAPGELSEQLLQPLPPRPPTPSSLSLPAAEKDVLAEPALWDVPPERRHGGECQSAGASRAGAAMTMSRARNSLSYGEYFAWLRSVLPEELPADHEDEAASKLGLSGLELLRDLARRKKAAEKEEAPPGIRPLSAEERRLASEALDGGNPKDVLVSRFSVDLTRQQIECLLPGTWLNDEVINFYYKLLQERSKRPGYAKCWFANSFFWPKLSGNNNEYSFKDVKRWTTKAKVDVFALDYVLFPMNIGETHWAMGAIDFKAKGFRYFDSMFCNPHRNFAPFLRRYLDDEHKAKKGGKPFPDVENWDLIKGERPPQQKNGYDCGVFTCFFGDYFSAEKEMIFCQEDMPDLRLRLAARITRGDEDDWWGDGR
eukprot:TRINITY_DN8634_c0_g1_i1.p1 TRINITY_DN8634_c0_g1~~TRINITY_DN8634_c0_g1_i1.p1  ORF type:complete len:456 (+),score=101.28 TRINITY_DN8634_c0_g1_i1:39-1370(+)